MAGAAAKDARAPSSTSILVSGASVAGPAVAYWLCRYGFDVTVVERTPELRKSLGGHAVDLFGASVDIAEWMGILPDVLAARTRTDLLVFERPGKPAIDLDFSKLVTGVFDRHVEIMRGELASIMYDATKKDVEYQFGDSITVLGVSGDGVRAEFENARPRTFGLVIGADGLHSTVRQLAFGDEAQFRHYIGGYFSVFTVPNYLGLTGRMRIYTTPGKVAAVYPVWQTGEARAVFLCRRAREFSYDYRDVDQQKRLIRHVFGDEGWEVPRLLEEMDRSPDFYFDSISQIRMPSWSTDRISLVGDAAYSPGAAVGGGTTVAIIGAYVLAGELSVAGGDPELGFRNYEKQMHEFVDRSRTIGPASIRTLIPRTPRQVWLAAQLMRFIQRLPAGAQHRLASIQGSPARALESINLRRYPAIR
jgi:2-polyprenyl-6-methoxyphenol hydroxylase-like FAD-dependent oxidoreductase